MISPIVAPRKGAPLTALWKPLGQLIAVVNALLNLRFEPANDWRLEIEPGSAVLKYVAGGGGATTAAPPHAWQSYAAPFLGSGSPPADQGRRRRLYPGTCNGLRPSNWTAEFIVPENTDDGFWVWLDATWSPTLGLTAVSLGSGLVLPVSPQGDPVAGTPPTRAYCPLLFWTSKDGAVDPAWQLQFRSLVLVQHLRDFDGVKRTLDLVFYAMGDPNPPFLGLPAF